MFTCKEWEWDIGRSEDQGHQQGAVQGSLPQIACTVMIRICDEMQQYPAARPGRTRTVRLEPPFFGTVYGRQIQGQ
jgi:hypothetical protein